MNSRGLDSDREIYSIFSPFQLVLFSIFETEFLCTKQQKRINEFYDETECSLLFWMRFFFVASENNKHYIWILYGARVLFDRLRIY